jgi:hypothetical protein
MCRGKLEQFTMEHWDRKDGRACTVRYLHGESGYNTNRIDNETIHNGILDNT